MEEKMKKKKEKKKRIGFSRTLCSLYSCVVGMFVSQQFQLQKNSSFQINGSSRRKAINPVDSLQHLLHLAVFPPQHLAHPNHFSHRRLHPLRFLRLPAPRTPTSRSCRCKRRRFRGGPFLPLLARHHCRCSPLRHPPIFLLHLQHHRLPRLFGSTSEV